MSFQIFQLSTILKNKRQTIECCIYLTAFVFIIYISFYIGQLLIHHSNDVFKELCNIPFYNFSVQTQKLLLLLLIRSIKPTELSIGGMFVVSHEVFAGVSSILYFKFFSNIIIYVNSKSIIVDST
ncbi:uncharacterized protein LOC122633953 [Vespula pensylvanica]|uniref:uncharacterized protein LOC122633953 n=1 Tax=Vespula pensylvanica TaxID=30213 RepID=UPI001CBA16BB|nr:uncharacterized protein LOC122633953 [Vespula pensylvanica]